MINQSRLIPCLLLDQKKLIKTVQFKNPKYIGDPVNTIKIFNDKFVDEIAILDITASKKRFEPDFHLIERIASECFVPLSYGGGISSFNQVKTIFSLGIEKVLINSNTFENPSLIRECADYFGSQSIIAGIDVKKRIWGRHVVYNHKSKKKTSLDPIEYSKHLESLGAGELFLTSIDNEGRMEGLDLELIKKVSKKVSIPVIACGGAKDLLNAKQGIDAGASAVGVGSLVVYQGPHKAVLINFPDLEIRNKIGI